MSPRKSSTSSANLLPPRPRYLGIEVAGVPFLSGRWLEEALRQRFQETGGAPPKIRVIRTSQRRALVEVTQLVAPRARELWNMSLKTPDGTTVQLTTRRTWGTLRKGKAWAKSPPSDPGPAGADVPPMGTRTRRPGWG